MSADGQIVEHVEDNPAAVEHEPTPFDDLAKTYGWEPTGKKSAKEYIEFALEKFPKRGEALSNQSRKLEEKDSELHRMKVIVDQLALDMKSSKEAAYKQALADLNMQKREAIAAGDVAQVERIEADAANLTTEQTIIAEQQAFFTRNPWFNGDSTEELAMRAYAQKKDLELINEKLPPKVHMQRIEDFVKERFKSYFSEAEEDTLAPTKRQPSVEAVQHENNTLSTKRGKVFTFNDLNDAQKIAANYFKENGQMTVDNYIKILVDSGELK